MSKFADALRRAARPQARPIGFAAASAPKQPTILLVARAAGAAVDGADAVIASDASGAGAALWGTEAAVSDRAAAAALAQAGAAFVIFDDASTDAAVLLEEGLDFVMTIALDASDTFLRTVESLPIAGLLAPALDGALTVRRTLDLRRLTAFTRKPLLLPVTAEIEPVALETLRDCGVLAVVADAAAVPALRSKIDGLPPRRRPRDEGGVTLGGRPSGAATPAPAPDEDEDDED